jgi:hypothetical protein
MTSWPDRLPSGNQKRRGTIFSVDAHRGNGKRYVVRADEKLTAFVELESAICIAEDLVMRMY